MFGREEEGIGDNAVLAAFDLVHLRGLIGDGHALMNDAHAALARHGDGQTGIGDGIHRGAEHRHVQADAGHQLGMQIDILGQHAAAMRHKQHVVKRQPFANFVKLKHLYLLPLSSHRFAFMETAAQSAARNQPFYPSILLK